MGAIELKSVEKWFGEVQVIKGVDLSIADGEFVIFVGPSGCGKSTLLRMIAGLEETSAARSPSTATRTPSPPSNRGLAMVFQSYALYPHMTVRQNLGFGLRTSTPARRDQEAKVAEVAKMLQMEPLLDRRPKDLSGGQRQRVAIGRAMVRDPTVFLFDEPLSNLDAELRVDMRGEIAKLHKRLGNTMIYVTHDQVEAMTMADKIVVLDLGSSNSSVRPLDLYNAPRTSSWRSSSAARR
jgi:multiple sugar transport system ATP-binding protein